MTTRQELIDEAVVIRSETLADRNTAERVGKNLQDISERVAFPSDAPADLWVDEATGDDTNVGSQAEPYATLDRALREWGAVVEGDPSIHVLPAVAATGHVSEEFWSPRVYRGLAKIIGEGVTEINPAVALTTYNELLYTFTGQTWTDGEWSGYDLEATNAGPNTFPEPTNRRTIIWNTADTITVAIAHRAEDPGTNPEAGDTFRVVEPAVKIDTAQVDKERRTVFGGQGADTRRSFERMRSSLWLENLELRAPDGDTEQVVFSGTFHWYGLHITKDSSFLLTVVVVGGVIQAGEFLSNVPRQYGWGVSLRDRSGNPVRPGLDIDAGNVSTMCYSGGGIQARGGTRLLLLAAMVEGLGRSGFPHASVYSDTGHVVTLSSATEPNIYIRNFDGEMDVEAENARIEIYKTIHHLGSGAIARARTGGYVTIGIAPTIVGSLGVASEALYGGQIRITGWDGNLLGDVSAGQTTPVPRAQAVWAVDEAVEGSESSWIYRTS